MLAKFSAALVVVALALPLGCASGGSSPGGKKDAGGSGGSSGSGGGGGSGGGSGGSDAGSGGKDGASEPGIGGAGDTCLQLQTCANACMGMDAMTCVDACVAKGSDTAKAQWKALDDCINMACMTECDPMMGSDSACKTCVFDSQCAATGAACKMADETCVGKSPDPDCKKGGGGP